MNKERYKKFKPVTESYSINAFSDEQSKTYDRLNKILSRFKSLDRKYVPRKSIDGSDKVMLSKSGKDFVNIYKDGSFEIVDNSGKVTARIKDIDDFSDNDIGVIFKKELSVTESVELDAYTVLQNWLSENPIYNLSFKSYEDFKEFLTESALNKNVEDLSEDENYAIQEIWTDNLLYEDILNPEQDDFKFDESADESAACEASDEVAKYYLMIDEIQNDEDFDNVQELIESARVDGDITEDEYTQLQIELANRK